MKSLFWLFLALCAGILTASFITGAHPSTITRSLVNDLSGDFGRLLFWPAVVCVLLLVLSMFGLRTKTNK